MRTKSISQNRKIDLNLANRLCFVGIQSFHVKQYRTLLKYILTKIASTVGLTTNEADYSPMLSVHIPSSLLMKTNLPELALRNAFHKTQTLFSSVYDKVTSTCKVIHLTVRSVSTANEPSLGKPDQGLQHIRSL